MTSRANGSTPGGNAGSGRQRSRSGASASSGASGSSGAFASGMFLVARARDTAYVRVVGLGTAVTCATFVGFAEAMAKQGYRRLVCDLAECRGIDSTFMGTLARLRGDIADVVLVNTSSHCLQQLRSVGIDHLLHVEETPQEIPKGVTLLPLSCAEATPRDRAKLILRAHQELIRLDRKNEQLFGAFVRGLEREVGVESDDGDDDMGFFFPDDDDGGDADDANRAQGAGRPPA